jgi:hypothetical protein
VRQSKPQLNKSNDEVDSKEIIRSTKTWLVGVWYNLCQFYPISLSHFCQFFFQLLPIFFNFCQFSEVNMPSWRTMTHHGASWCITMTRHDACGPAASQSYYVVQNVA